MILALSIAGIAIAIVPAGMFLANLSLFGEPEPNAPASGLEGADVASPRPAAIAVGSEERPIADSTQSVSVLIPARDEAGGIANSIEAALASRHVDIEVVVLDDHSTDDTAEIVKRDCGI